MLLGPGFLTHFFAVPVLFKTAVSSLDLQLLAFDLAFVGAIRADELCDVVARCRRGADVEGSRLREVTLQTYQRGVIPVIIMMQMSLASDKFT